MCGSPSTNQTFHWNVMSLLAAFSMLFSTLDIQTPPEVFGPPKQTLNTTHTKGLIDLFGCPRFQGIDQKVWCHPWGIWQATNPRWPCFFMALLNTLLRHIKALFLTSHNFCGPDFFDGIKTNELPNIAEVPWLVEPTPLKNIIYYIQIQAFQDRTNMKNIWSHYLVTISSYLGGPECNPEIDW